MDKHIEIKNNKKGNQKIEKEFANVSTIKKSKVDAEYKIVEQNADYLILCESQSS